jgi:hypothetical protein
MRAPFLFTLLTKDTESCQTVREVGSSYPACGATQTYEGSRFVGAADECPRRVVVLSQRSRMFHRAHPRKEE